MAASLIKSNRGKDLLLLENFTFYKTKVLKSGEVFWRCIQRKCSAKVFTIGSDLTISRNDLVHNHEPNQQKLNRKIVSNSCILKAQENIAEKPSKIISRVLATNLPDTTITTTDVSYIRKNMYNSRRKVMPGGHPSNIQEVHEVLQLCAPHTSKDANKTRSNVLPDFGYLGPDGLREDPTGVPSSSTDPPELECQNSVLYVGAHASTEDKVIDGDLTALPSDTPDSRECKPRISFLPGDVFEDTDDLHEEKVFGESHAAEPFTSRDRLDSMPRRDVPDYVFLGTDDTYEQKVIVEDSGAVSTTCRDSQALESQNADYLAERARLVIDSDYQFLMSLLPYLQDIPKNRKMYVRTKLMGVLMDESCRTQHLPTSTTNYHP